MSITFLTGALIIDCMWPPETGFLAVESTPSNAGEWSKILANLHQEKPVTSENRIMPRLKVRQTRPFEDPISPSGGSGTGSGCGGREAEKY
jgi:hypothetical protein